MNTQTSKSFVDETWSKSIIPAITEYIRIPNKSPAFDPQWKKNGHMDRAVALIEKWCKSRAIEGMTLEVVRLKNEKGEERTPVIFMEIPGTAGTGGDTVLLYGHLDKQPEFSGWNPGLSPWEPVMRGERLYGRGGADDGYAAFASLTAIEALKRQKIPHARCVVLIEACEESGSYDLPFYIDALEKRIGDVSLVICLDSGCGNYDQLWSTTSLRGMIGGNLSIETISEGVHSGDASGIVPSSFRILRQVLDRLEDSATGRVIPKDFYVDIPAQRIAQAKVAAKVLGDEIWNKYPWHKGVKPMHTDNTELMLNRTWRPALSITGARGLPDLESAGNVLRPLTAVKISLRVPPTADTQVANQKLKELLEKDPPSGAKVTFDGEKSAGGWNAPALAPWLEASVSKASSTYFGKEAVYMGEGGSIPFMGMLGKKFPQAQFLITGVLGPHSNAHGPNEFLDIPTARKLTACVAQVVAEHVTRTKAPAMAGR
ncbi:MAG: M20 family metallopeptidase [Planctomycetes bacterium]|nr:M20 family metallopeptidase [Planctomycetota bacterium]